MATGLRLEDRLEGAGKFSPWKANIILLLQENELWEVVETVAFQRESLPL